MNGILSVHRLKNSPAQKPIKGWKPAISPVHPAGLCVVASLLLAGCAGGNAPAPGSTNTTYDNPSAAVRGSARPTSPIAPSPLDNSEINETAKQARPPETAVVPFVPINISTLENLSQKELVTKIGKPEMIRSEGPAEIWQYRSDRCALDAFFYPQGKSKTPKLVHFLARLRNGEGDIAPQSCLDEIVRGQTSQN